jgi:chromosome segregation ATPase
MTPEQREKVRKVLGIPEDQVDEWDKDTVIEELSDVALMLDTEEHIEEVAHFKTRIRTLEMQLRNAKAEIAQMERMAQRPPVRKTEEEKEAEEEGKAEKKAAEEEKEEAEEEGDKAGAEATGEMKELEAKVSDLEAQLAASMARNAKLTSENAELQNLIDEGVELHDKQEAELKSLKARLDEAGL